MSSWVGKKNTEKVVQICHDKERAIEDYMLIEKKNFINQILISEYFLEKIKQSQKKSLEN